MTAATPTPELRNGHRAACHKPPLQASDATGGTRYTCPGCGKYTFTAEQAAPAQPRPAAPSSYVCRVHYAPVNWRGTGCKQCANDQIRKPKKPKQTDQREDHR